MISAPATRLDQARHYAAVRARLWPSRRQFIVAPKPEWTTPTLVEVVRWIPEAPPQPGAVQRGRGRKRGPPISLNLPGRLREIMDEIALRERPSTAVMIAIVARVYGVPPDHIVSRSRKFALPRQIAMTLIRRHRHGTLSGTYPAVARIFGRDHTTVIHAVRKIGPLIESIVSSPPPSHVSTEVT